MVVVVVVFVFSCCCSRETNGWQKVCDEINEIVNEVVILL